MPRKPHHQVLIFKRSVWLSIAWDNDADTQSWRVYARPRVRGRGGLHGGQRPWWIGLTPKGELGQLPNAKVPLHSMAYAYTEWTFDEPKRANGTDLWVPTGDPDMWAVYYSWHNWDSCLLSSDEEWVYCYNVEWVA